MSFGVAYREHDGSPDFHNQAEFQRHPQHSSLAVAPQDYAQWHEMDFTNTHLSSALNSPAAKYPASMDTESQAGYLRPAQISQRREPATLSGDLYSTGPFSYSQLLNMDSDMSPMDESSGPSSRPDSNMLDDDVREQQQTSPLLIQSSIKSSNDQQTEKLCPLIAGQVDTCQPQRCGPDAPCMNFTSLPPIEECTSVPCITQPATSSSILTETSPPTMTRTTTANTTASLRRSSGSSLEQPLSVVSVPRRPAGRRRPRANSDDDDEKPPTSQKSDPKQRAKQAHSLVERKYRENLNAKIAQLHSTLQASHYGPKVGDDGDSDNPVTLSGVPSSKVRKSDVLTEAMNYVNQTEVEMRHMENEIHRLTERVRVLEKLVRCEDCSLLKQMVNLQVQTSV